MASYTKNPLKKIEVNDLGGGLNEAGPITKIPIRECMKCENFRVSEGGETKEKRPGLTKLDSVYSFGSKKVYGVYGIEEEEEVKILACLEDSIQLKSEGIWTEIFTPTTEPEKPVTILQDKGLVFIAGYEKLITVKEEEAFYSGIEAPTSAPTVNTQAASSDIKSAEYPETNQDHCGEHKVTTAQTLLAQSFKPTIDCEINKVKLKLKKIGSPTGNLWVEIHDSKSGTSGDKNASGAIVGQATGNLSIATLTGSFATKTLTFSGTKPDLAEDETYYFVIYTDRAVDTDEFVVVGFDCSSPTYSGGKYWEINDSLNWTSYSSVDIVFEIHGTDSAITGVGNYGVEESWGEYLRSNTARYLLAQSFKLDLASELTSLQIPLKRLGQKSWFSGKTIWVEIHSSKTGTSATKNASSNIVGQASATRTCSGISDSDYNWATFTFSGTKPNLSASTTYYLMFYTNYVIDENNKAILWTKDENVGQGDYDDGRSHWINSSMSWSNKDPDFSFKMYGRVTAEVNLLEYAFGKIDDIKNLRESTSQTLVAQSFKVYNSSDVSKVKLYLSKVDSPAGDIWVEIHKDKGGTSGTKDLSDEIVGEASDDVAIATTEKAYFTAGETEISINDVVTGGTSGKTATITQVVLESGTWAGDDAAGYLYTTNANGAFTPGEDLEVAAAKVAEITADWVILIDSFPAYGWVSFNFSGVKPSLELDKTYYIVVYGGFGVSATDFIRVGMDKVDPTYSIGSRWDIDDSAPMEWTELSHIDIFFELYLLASDLDGDYSYVVTYLRGGNYPCESNPSPETETKAITAGNVFKLTNIPVSSEPEVDEKNIWRTKEGESTYNWVNRIANATVEYEDDVGDPGLGDEVSYDNYPPPAGDSIEIWDDTLWVSGVPGYMEGLFRSQRDYLEQFLRTATGYMPLREKEADPTVRNKEFKNNLYAFKSNSIWGISRSGSSYLIDKMPGEVGLAAAASLADCGEFLIFLSNYHRIEIFDGYKIITPKMTNKVRATLKSINKTYVHRSTAQNYEKENEFKLSIPTGSSQVPNETIVFNYKEGNFFIDTYNQNICSVNVLDISKGERAMVYGTTEGELYKVDPDATADDGELIESEFQTGWIGDVNWLSLRKMWLDFTLPADKNIIFKVYSNFRESSDLSMLLEGSTPSGVDPEMRNVIHQRIKMAIKGSFFSFRFINAEDLGGKLEIIKFSIYVRRRPSKKTIKAE